MFRLAKAGKEYNPIGKEYGKTKDSTIVVLLAAALLAGAAGSVGACATCGCSGAAAPAQASLSGEKAPLTPQATCAIMGGKIDKRMFVDVGGHRIYACCAACLPKIKADPDKAIVALKAKG